MLPWRSQEKQLHLWKQFFWAGFSWLALGGCCSLLLLIQHISPAFFEGNSLFSMGRLQLHVGNLCLFGGVYLLLIGAWILRLSQLRESPVFDWFPLWEFGFGIWNCAILWGFVSALFGQHTDIPILSWQAPVYGALMLSGATLAAACTLNLPSSWWVSRSPSLFLLLFGLWSLPAVLFGFILFPIQSRLFSSAVLVLLLHLSFFLPAFALVLPLSGERLSLLQQRRLRGFFWGFLFLLPLSAPLFSSSSRGVGVLAITQLVNFGLFLLFIPLLWHWWSEPAKFMGLYSLPSSSAEAPSTPKATHWHPFVLAGGLCMMLSLATTLTLSLLRLQGITPSPSWYNSVAYLLIGGSVALWLQGLLHLLLPLSAHCTPLQIKLQWRTALAGALLFTIGAWLELLLHMHLDQVSATRGLLVPYFARILQLTGALSTAYALTLTAKQLFPALIQLRIETPPTTQHP